MLSSLCWVAGSDAKEHPTKYVPTEEELQKLNKKYQLKAPSVIKTDHSNKEKDEEDEKIIKEFNLENYDEEEGK